MIRIHSYYSGYQLGDTLFPCKGKLLLMLILSLAMVTQTFSQEPGVAQTIEVMSSYKPVLRPFSKLTFSASPIPPSPFSAVFSYSLPDQQYKVTMKPLEARAVSYQPDSLKLRNHSMASMGYGNFNRLFAEAAVACGAGQSFQYQIQAGYHAEQGSIRLQESNRVYGSIDFQKENRKSRFFGHLAYRNENYFFYGNDSLTTKTPADSLRQPFERATVELGWMNHSIAAKSLQYRPALRFEMFNATNTKEWNTLIRLPLSLEFRPQYVFSWQVNADLTHFQTVDTSNYQNHLFSIDPSFRFPIRDMNFTIGGRAAWDQGNFLVLPNIGLEAFVKNKKAVFMAGWQASIQKNNYQQLTLLNPWISRPWSPQNTRKEEFFAGVRGDLPHGLHYRLRAGFTQFYHQVLYLNAKRASVFEPVYEANMQTIQVVAEAYWRKSENLSASLEATYYQVTHQRTFANPWHFIPFQVNATAYWKPAQKWLLHARIYGWQGPLVLNDTLGTVKRLQAVADLNLQTEFKINKFFTAWLQGNNLLNQAYQRWNHYPVLGLQVVGGIRLTFEGK
ncbi:MAG: hypothetical protein KGP35_03155 [Bacteroidetes bacterium]|nr:hypothetical protein [Bacteroidota bacterium]